MRKLLFSFLAITTILLTSCLETTQEITVKQDGSGTVSVTNDMSALIPLLKNMPGADKELGELGGLGDKAIDSSFALADGVDSIPNLSASEKELAKTGTLRLKVDMKGEKALTNLTFNFTSAKQVPALTSLASKIMAETLKDKMGDKGQGMDEMPEVSSVDDYYTLEFSNDEIKRKVIADKYAGVGSDEYLKSASEAAGMGLVMKSNYIIHLPRPVKSFEGKNVKLSDDKLTATISATIEDFLEDASVFEFKIKY